MNMKDLNFFKKVYKFYSVGIFSDDPLEKNEFYLIQIYKPKVEVWAFCTQWCAKEPKEEELLSNFHEFGSITFFKGGLADPFLQ